MQAIAKGLLLGKRQCTTVLHMHNGVNVLTLITPSDLHRQANLTCNNEVNANLPGVQQSTQVFVNHLPCPKKANILGKSITLDIPLVTGAK